MEEKCLGDVKTGVVFFSGGTALNSLCTPLRKWSNLFVCHVLPVSDDGGSTREITRVFSGPAIGDIRSRLVRLSDGESDEGSAVCTLLQYRLPSDWSQQRSKEEWQSIVNGTHPLWSPISETYKSLLLAFFVYISDLLEKRTEKRKRELTEEGESNSVEKKKKQEGNDTNIYQNGLTKQNGKRLYCNSTKTNENGENKTSSEAQSNNSDFQFPGASIGNLFFTAARLFFSSIDAAIFLFSRVAGIPPQVQVHPIISVNHTIKIMAKLQNGQILVGQNEISHPGNTAQVNKEFPVPLMSPIQQICYCTEDGRIEEPVLSDSLKTKMKRAGNFVYSIGSLFTSIVPLLIVKGVGELIASQTNGKKILILNGYSDRETLGMTGLDFVHVIADSLNRYGQLSNPINSYITHIIFMKESDIRLEEEEISSLLSLGIQSLVAKTSKIEHLPDLIKKKCFYCPNDLLELIKTCVSASSC